MELRYARQSRPDGSADAVRRAVEAGARTPFLVSAADTLYALGDVGRFAEAFRSSENASALAFAPDGTPAPLWGLTGEVLLEDLAGPPFELPYTLNLPDREEDRWRMHLDVSRASVRLVRERLQPADATDQQ